MRNLIRKQKQRIRFSGWRNLIRKERIRFSGCRNLIRKERFRFSGWRNLIRNENKGLGFLAKSLIEIEEFGKKRGEKFKRISF